MFFQGQTMNSFLLAPSPKIALAIDHDLAPPRPRRALLFKALA
jgi:hypothetical protein